jgi:hypothetical protein
MTETQDFVLAAHASLSNSEIQFLPVNALLGVSTGMATELSKIGIDMLRGLGLSRVSAQSRSAPLTAAHVRSGLSEADPLDEDEDPAAEKLRPIIGQFPT